MKKIQILLNENMETIQDLKDRKTEETQAEIKTELITEHPGKCLANKINKDKEGKISKDF